MTEFEFEQVYHRLLNILDREDYDHGPCGNPPKLATDLLNQLVADRNRLASEVRWLLGVIISGIRDDVLQLSEDNKKLRAMLEETEEDEPHDPHHCCGHEGEKPIPDVNALEWECDCACHFARYED